MRKSRRTLKPRVYAKRQAGIDVDNLKIEKNIPIRTSRLTDSKSSRLRAFLKKMKIGDSVFIPTENTEDQTLRRVTSYISSNSVKAGVKTTMLRERNGRKEGFRVWRIRK